jgi:diaminohydroxyphosphoribosylaminopyrimidine deaminase/5-amino-6-(5-phosphoribosylamino)uracil reductase
LRELGVTVDVGLLEEQARHLNEAFIKHVSTGMPFVIAKCAMSLDGKIATRTGESKWVTGETARAAVHRLRNEVDAILVGSRTVMLDDPGLTTRVPEGKIKDPIRVVLDADDYLSADRKVFRHESEAPTWVAVPEGKSANVDADEILPIPHAEGGLDLRALMRELGRRNVQSVLIEGGGATHASAFEAGVVDKVMFFIAPKIIGGRDAVPAVGGAGVSSMAEAIGLRDMKATPFGEDILIEAYVVQD